MKIGFDYWNVISHYPKEFGYLAHVLYVSGQEAEENEVYVISAIGKGRSGTIKEEVARVLSSAGFKSEVLFAGVEEVVFESPKESPQLKLQKCQELGIDMFFDDRQDVVDLLNANGILAFLVPRKSKKTDIGAERV